MTIVIVTAIKWLYEAGHDLYDNSYIRGTIVIANGLESIWCQESYANGLWPILLTWINFNPCMDK